MTVNYIYETGALESFEQTLSFRIADAWVFANTTESFKPEFHHASEENVEYSWPRDKRNYEIHFNQDSMEFPMPLEEANGNAFQGLRTIVRVDIFTRDTTSLKSFIREFNRIIWDVLKPDGANRILKENGSISGIARFGKYHIQFRKEQVLEPEHLPAPHATGEIEVIWYKSRT